MKNNPEFIDLSWDIHEGMPIYPNDPLLKVEGGRKNEEDGFSLKKLSTAMHVGTHLDAPSHYLKAGLSVESIGLEKTIGFATKLKVDIIDNVIKTDDLDMCYHNAYRKHSKIVIETGYSTQRNKLDYFDSFPAFEPSLTEFLVENGIELIGLDMPSIRFVKTGAAEAHRSLLRNQIVIVENLMNLALLDDEFFLLCQPLKLIGFDGSMIRAVGINRWKTFY